MRRKKMLGGEWSIKEKRVRNRKEEEGRQAYIKNGLPELRCCLAPEKENMGGLAWLDVILAVPQLEMDVL